MAWKMKTKGATVNDGGSQKLKVGKHAYEIIGAEMALVKGDETGREKQVVLEFRSLEDSSYTCKEYIAVMAENDTRQRIAEETLRAFVQAAGITTAEFGEKSLKKLVGTTVVVETTSKTSGSGDDAKTYINVRHVEAYESGEESEEDEPEAEEEESEDESEDESEEESEEEEEPAPAKSKSKGKSRPW